MRCWAHSDRCGLGEDDPNARWQPLNEHLRQVGALAEAFAKEARPEDSAFHAMARVSGLLHDLGKYTQKFQRKIRGEPRLKAPHSAHGAAMAYQRAKSVEAAFAIAGHHAGLPNRKGGRSDLWERIQEVLRGTIDDLWRAAVHDCPELATCLDAVPQTSNDPHTCDLRTRMLFSCLVDADRIDSSGENLTSARLVPASRLESLLAYIEERAAEVSEGPVKRARAAVLQACRTAAMRPGNIFSLTVPTGGAKTLSSMAFALERAVAFPDTVRRIIVVIPYLSIIEQNAQHFIDALGKDAVLEHHSGDTESRDDEDGYENPAKRRGTENWDAPIVVTTSVRFFESLFSNRPSDLRRVHNIARSVVILDEVQTLPRKFVQPILSVMKDLADNWGTTFVFCTATQPAFERSKPDNRRWEPGTIEEIMPEPRELFGQLKRVEVEWREKKSTWKEIAAEMAQARRALCIVNTRDHAAALHREVLQDATIEPASIFHLSTRMCAAHRLNTIGEIKSLLKNATGACIVVSTQLVEAGVDIDFPVVYRAMGPLDSIAQAAGRCDREGRLTATLGRPAGRVIVFGPEEAKLPSDSYREATDRTQALVRAGGLSLDEPNHMRQYFERLYGEGDLGREIEDLRAEMKFRKVNDEFEIISDRTQSVFVPYDTDAREAIAELNQTGVLHLRLRRRLQRYTIGLYPNQIYAGAARGVLYEVRAKLGLWVCAEGFYDEKLGFVPEPSAADMVV